jgi:hypothetical protein
MLLNRCAFIAVSGGTAAFVVSAGVTGYATPAGAGAIDGTIYSYMAQSSDLTQWEVGFGAYTVSGTSLARTTVFNNSSGLTTNINFTNPPIVTITPTTLDFRDVLQANRTYFVRSDGADTNNGLANTAGGAFLTLAHAVAVVTGTLDFNGFTVTIQLGQTSITWTTQFLLSNPWVGGGNLVFDGNSNTLTTSSGGDAGSAIRVTCTLPGVFTFQNVTLTTTAAGGSCLNHQGAGTVTVGTGVTFGATVGRHVWSAGNGQIINLPNNYTISGGAVAHLYASITGGSMYLSAATVTLTGTPAFSTSFSLTQDGGVVQSFGTTFSGAATGARYSSQANGVIDTFGGGANYFPGNSAGVTGNGGVYV